MIGPKLLWLEGVEGFNRLSDLFSSSLTRLMTSICTPISLGQIALDLERKSGINYASDKEDEY